MYQLHDQEAVLKSVGVSPDHCLSSLRSLSGLGSSGRHPSNIRQQLVTLLGEPSCPHPFVSRVELTVLKPRGGEETSPTEFPVLLPHELFSHIFEHFPQRFDDIFCNGGGVANLKGFWDGAVALRDPRLKFHSAAQAPRWRERCVPLSLHGDAVATTKIGQSGTRSFDVFSWAGLLATGSTKVVKLYTWGVFEPCKTEAGMSRIWAIVTWSLRALADGIWPETDVDGVPFRKGTREHRLAGSRLAGDYFAIPWILKADWEHWHKCWWLKYHSRNDFCEYCDANRGPNASMLFNNVRSDAAWKGTIVGPEAWRERNPNRHPLLALPNMSIHNIECDELHCLYLGVSMYFVGSVLFHLCYNVLPASAADNLNTIWNDLVKAYGEVGSSCQYSSLSLGMFVNTATPRGSYPRLKGKGAELKDIIAPLCAVFDTYRRRRDRRDDLIAAALSHLLDAQNVLSDSAKLPFLPGDDSSKLQRHIDSFLQAYQALAHQADLQGELLWSIVPKHHALWHLAARSRYLHPRRGNCCIDESFVGVIKEIVRSCTHGLEPHLVSSRVMENYRFGLHFLQVYGDDYHRTQ